MAILTPFLQGGGKNQQTKKYALNKVSPHWQNFEHQYVLTKLLTVVTQQCNPTHSVQKLKQFNKTLGSPPPKEIVLSNGKPKIFSFKILLPLRTFVSLLQLCGDVHYSLMLFSCKWWLMLTSCVSLQYDQQGVSNQIFYVLSTTLGHFRTTTLCHICKFTLKKQQHLFSHRKPFLKLNLLNPSIHTYKTKYTYTDIGHKLSKQVSPFNIALVKKKKHIRLGHTGTGDHSI